MTTAQAVSAHRSHEALCEAEREIEARARRAARALDNDVLVRRVSRAVALGVTVVAVLGSGLLYWQIGAPGAPD